MAVFVDKLPFSPNKWLGRLVWMDKKAEALKGFNVVPA